MNKKLLSSLFLVGLLQTSYCLASEPIQLNSVFNEKEVEWVKEKGSATVFGSANITLENGEAKGCATFNIELLPVAAYSNERIHKIYGNNLGGQILMSQNPPKFTPDVKAYHELEVITQCNAKNEFVMNEVPQGEFYIIAFIIWDEDKDGTPHKAGGAVMKRISVKENTKVEVHL